MKFSQTNFLHNPLDILNNESDKVLCYHCGSKNFIKRGKRKGANGDVKQVFNCKNCGKNFVTNPDYDRIKAHLSNINDDIWKAEDLNIKISKHKNCSKLIAFDLIRQPWLKHLAKRFVLYMSSLKELSTIQRYTWSLNKFSNFLTAYPIINDIHKVDRQLMIEFLQQIKHENLSTSASSAILGSLRTFFDIGNRNEWFDVSPHLIVLEDYPKPIKPLPRYIPEEVMNQLNNYLESLPEPVMRMVLIIQECGLRIGELLELPINCLEQDASNNYSIRFMRWKMKKEDIIPISKELAQVIKEQQQYIESNFHGKFNYLFCARKGRTYFRPVPKVMRTRSFVDFLRNLADEFNICDNSGRKWHFQSHQFRHTVGTRMINNGVPQHIIQRYLGHDSPNMTMVYAHIHDATLRKEIEKYHETRVVNFTGETVELEESILSSNDDLEWFKKNVQARALEHGYCGRPKVLGDCDIPGFDGCYNCPHWRTNKNFLPILKDTLERTNNVLEKAKNYGWQLQFNKNTPIKENLEKVIKTLEVDNDQ